MNENIDLTKILKDCPKGTKLYTPVWGEVVFVEVVESGNSLYPILIFDSINNYIYLTKDGHYLLNRKDSECIIFPSKEQRDWSKFSAPWYKKEKLVEPKFKVGDKIVNVSMKYWGAQGIISKITEDKYIFSDGSCMSISNQDSWELDQEKFDPKTLKTFDKVIGRDAAGYVWQSDYFSHIRTGNYPYKCIGSWYTCCIPYNDETKHLVGTTNEAPEYYRYWEN